MRRPVQNQVGVVQRPEPIGQAAAVCAGTKQLHGLWGIIVYRSGNIIIADTGSRSFVHSKHVLAASVGEVQDCSGDIFVISMVISAGRVVVVISIRLLCNFSQGLHAQHACLAGVLKVPIRVQLLTKYRDAAGRVRRNHRREVLPVFREIHIAQQTANITVISSQRRNKGHTTSVGPAGH